MGWSPGGDQPATREPINKGGIVAKIMKPRGGGEDGPNRSHPNIQLHREKKTDGEEPGPK